MPMQMPFLSIRKYFSLRKSTDDRGYDHFFKIFNHQSHTNSNNGVRMYVLVDNPNRTIYDSHSKPDSRSSIEDDEYSTLFEIAASRCHLVSSKEILSGMKIHSLKCVSSHVNMPQSPPYSKCSKNTVTRSIRQVLYLILTYQVRHVAEPVRNIVICLLINVEQMQLSLISNPKSNTNSTLHHDLQNICINQGSNTSDNDYNTPSSNKLMSLLFEHFIQFGVSFESLVVSIVNELLYTNELKYYKAPFLANFQTRRLMCENVLESVYMSAYQQINSLLCDMCVPRLMRPVWPTISKSLFTLQVNELDCHSMMENMLPADAWSNFDLNAFNSFSNSCDIPTNHHDFLVYTFVRNCFNVLINKAFAKDKGNFLSQLITGILMFHQGWVASVMPQDEDPYQCLPKGESDPFFIEAFSGLMNQLKANPLLEQFLVQYGCTPTALVGNLLKNQQCHMMYASTVLCGLQNDHLLALLYLVTYFLRYPAFVKSKESLPDLGKAELFNLEQQQRQCRSNGKTRRKSGSAAADSSSDVFQQANVNSGGLGDSGISSQEDLSAPMFYSVSAGSSPSHTSGMALCFKQRLTQDQCRFAEEAAQVQVRKELAAAHNVNQKISDNSSIWLNNLGAVSTATSSHSPNAMNKNPNIPLYSQGGSQNSSGSQTMHKQTQRSFIEIPLLIEQHDDDFDDDCICFGSDSPCLQTCYSASNLMLNNCDNLYLSESMQTTRTINMSVKSSPHSQSSNSLLQLEGTSPPSSMLGSLVMPVNNVNSSIEIESNSPPKMGPHAAMNNPVWSFNHSRIGGSVRDRYAQGLVLQATHENFESFCPRMKQELSDWMHYGKDMLKASLNSKAFESFYDISPKSSHRQSPTSSLSSSSSSLDFNVFALNKWNTCCLVANTDCRTVTAFTVGSFQRDSFSASPGPKTASKTDLRNIASMHRRQPSKRAPRTLSTSSNMTVCGVAGGTPLRNIHRTNAAAATSATVEEPGCRFPSGYGGSQTIMRAHKISASPLILKMLEGSKIVFEKTNCPLLALRYVETCLQVIYRKSVTLSSLLIHEGSIALRSPVRLSIVSGCEVGDLPLMLSICRSNSLAAADVLQESNIDCMNFT